MPALASDGTSQAARHWPELDPAHAVLDPRGAHDWLAFVRAYARELVFTDEADGSDSADWRGLLGDDDAALAAAAALLQQAPPGPRLPGPLPERLSRPHVALLLAFVALLGRTRAAINGISARHLALLYRDTLRLQRRPALPDRLHVLAQAEATAQRLLLPAGTALDAGQDAAGRQRIYTTQADLVVSGLQVAQLRSLHADIRRTGLREAAFAHRVSGTRQQAFVSMWRIALGQPAPGDALPAPIVPGIPAVPSGQRPEIDFNALQAAAAVVQRVIDAFAMPLLDDYRELMRLRRQRQEREAGEAATVAAVLAQVAAAVRPGQAYAAGEVQDFEANLARALGLDAAGYAHFYDGLPEVKSAEQALAALPTRPDVQAFVQQRLRLSLDDFRRMMLARLQIEGAWAEIARLIEAAARRKRASPDWQLPAEQRRRRDVAQWLAVALDLRSHPVGAVADAGLDGFHAAFEGIERWAAMSAERLHFVMGVGQRLPPLESADWVRVFELMAEAHESRVYERRRALLAQAAAAGRQAGQPAVAMAALLAVVLGDALPAAEALARLGAFGVRADDGEAVARAQAGQPLDDATWLRLLGVLEVAQRNRENFVPEPPQQVQWRWLHALADARQAAPAAAAATPGASRWPPFGQVAAARAAQPPAELLGCAFASPLLWLAEGQRTVQLLLGFDGAAAAFDAAALRRLMAPPEGQGHSATQLPWLVQISTEKGWETPQQVTLDWLPAAANPAGASPGPAGGMGGYPAVPGVDTTGLRLLRLGLELGPRQPASAAPRLAVHGLNQATPVLRLMLRPVWDDVLEAWTSPYTLLRRLRLQRVKLSVGVSGLASLLLRNDDAVLDARKPFEPFGFQPAAGARLQIGHAELACKPLDSVGFRFEWMGAPAALDAHYANYEGALKAASFTARVGLRDGRLFSPADRLMRLFGDGSTADAVQQQVTPLPDPGTPAWPQVPEALASDVGEWPRCLVWELAGDFQHAVYPGQALKKSLQLAAAIAARREGLDAASFQVNAPYTPKLKRLLVDYSASIERAVPALGRSAAGQPREALLQLLHLHPFGSTAPGTAELAAGAALLPAYDDEGELYIGLSGARPPQRLSLLLQLAEGSADPDVAPPALQWSVLSANRWQSLQGQGGAAGQGTEAAGQAGANSSGLLVDGTHGLIHAGIVELALPAVQPSTLLPGADGAAPLLWLRVAAAQGSRGVCQVLGVHPDAVLAERQLPAGPHGGDVDSGADPDADTDADADADTDATLRDGPLPAHSIAAPLAPLAGLAALQQPYSAFGGRPAEDDAAFRVRASERLRHRGRALTPWDVERLVLEHFAQLHKVRCLRADEFEPALAPPPGTVTVVVVPDMVQRQPFDPSSPKVPADQIRDIAAFLTERLPTGARLRVINPHVVLLKLRCGIRLRPGVDEGPALQRINDALNRHLAPWAWAEGSDLVIGGRIHANSILHFIEQRDEVDYVAELRLFTADDGHWRLAADRSAVDGQGPAASPGRPDGVLVPAAQHELLVIGQADYRAEGLDGIGHMKLELDFIVA
ncbi:hypothetical protein [Aquabacterium sp. OR-4]|uniref:hypothetical protein n=1 Tax=Aquabacterium sp. OR-4 TaxID=2978127 RepID=UPI0021B18F36|nr:hypothetical protein [Aquabacterium sp. OR-4]MDT7836286.1 hypothetical protein [Aquabacterium sp. OR-4]